jgi:hypothetical protein
MPSTTPHITLRRFDPPDERLDFEHHGHIDVIEMPDGTKAMRALLAPGWTWSLDEKPLHGGPDACPAAHVGYCIAGELAIRLVDTAEETVIRAGDFFEIPPGHDAYVLGLEPCVMIFFVAADASEPA